MGKDDQNTSERDEIRRIRRTIERAENAGDVDAFTQQLADEVAMLPASGPRRMGIAEVAAFHRDHLDKYDIDVSFSIEDITVLGYLAIEHGTYEATLAPTDGTERRDGGGDYLYVYERNSANDWEIIRMSW